MRARRALASVATAAAAILLAPHAASADSGVRTVTSESTRHGTVLVAEEARGTTVRTEGFETATSKELAVEYQVQETGYWCGPAATRIALSARMAPPSQADLAAQLGTHEGGTDHIGQITTVLNNNLGTGWYETKEMPNDPPTQGQKDLLWNDIVLDIDNNYPIVANIVAPPGNQPPGYPSDQTIYHYFAVIGYDDVNRTVLIADSANFGGNQIYWLSFDQLATLIPPKGYAA
jgi:hypothetical protein